MGGRYKCGLLSTRRCAASHKVGKSDGGGEGRDPMEAKKSKSAANLKHLKGKETRGSEKDERSLA